jgi:hypothetical protein
VASLGNKAFFVRQISLNGAVFSVLTLKSDQNESIFGFFMGVDPKLGVFCSNHLVSLIQLFWEIII